MLHTKQFGRYEIIRKLGRSMTDVYLALDREADRPVALKIIEESHDPGTQLALAAERRGVVIQKQLREVDARILEVYDYGESGGCFFVAMEYVEGLNISELLHGEKRLEPARAARYAREVLSQLGRLHSFLTEIDGRRRAVVHGDIKPSNIQIATNDQVRLLDFGIAKVITFTHNLTHHNLGSPSYCSPERLLKGQVDPNVDLWALGVTLYEMVAGTPPYQAQTTRKLENLIQSRRPPRALPENCPPALAAIIRRSLAADLERRYSNAAAFESDLAAFMEGKRTAAEEDTEPRWNTNQTIQKAPEPSPPRKIKFPTLPTGYLLHEFRFVFSTLAAGFVIGLFLLVPALRATHFWTESAPLRRVRDYTRASPAELLSDWRLYKTLERDSSIFGSVAPIRQPFRNSLVAAGDEVLDRYGSSSDPSLGDFEWKKAQLCYARALELDTSDSMVKGKLALVSAYLVLASAAPDAQETKAGFDEAAKLAPRSPAPHLGLARLYIYNLHNIGAAMAEFHQAANLGFKIGPREIEQQADGYLARAESELVRAERVSKISTMEEGRLLSLARRDFDRADVLYQPIDGYSKVSQSLETLYKNRVMQEELQATYELARAKVARNRRWR